MGALTKGWPFLPLLCAHCSVSVHPLFTFAPASLPQPCKLKASDRTPARCFSKCCWQLHVQHYGHMDSTIHSDPWQQLQT